MQTKEKSSKQSSGTPKMSPVDIKLSRQQSAVVDQMLSSGAFRQSLAGLAGTGKTVVAKYLYDMWTSVGEKVLVLAPTGKAAVVLRSKGVPATTVHSAIYHFVGKKEDVKGEVTLFFKDNGRSRFADRLIVDESSMITARMQADIEAKGIPVVWVGDPGQLPPVKAKGTELLSKPTHRLTEIHRQAADSPIIQLAYAVRNGAPLTKKVTGVEYTEVRGRGAEFVASEMLEKKIDRLIVGTNLQRVALNTEYRKQRGFNETLVPGDEIICCRNNYKIGVVNGEVFRVAKIEHRDKDVTKALLVSVDTGDRSYQYLWNAQFGLERTIEEELQNDVMLADYAYAVTCHKFQGSSARHVGVAAKGLKSDSARWNYTAVTRAEQQLTIFH